MVDEKNSRLLLRQLKDVQVQAERILAGDNSGAAIESFGRYCRELNRYIEEHVQEEGTRALLHEIPPIKYRRMEIAFWQYLVLPYWWIVIYHDYLARNRVLAAIRMAKEKYTHLEFRIRGAEFPH